VQHDPAGELLVDDLLGIARQSDGVGGLDEVGGRVVLPKQPRHAHREEVRLARIREVDGADWPRDSSNTEARTLERPARLALAQEGAVQVPVIRLRNLRVRDQVVEGVGAADGVDVLVRLSAEPAGAASTVPPASLTWSVACASSTGNPTSRTPPDAPVHNI
jgi:hypothetical protein